jgi:hypothetical protein
MFTPASQPVTANSRSKESGFERWRYSVKDAVQQGSVKQYEREMTQYQSALFRQVELSVHGGRMLYKGSKGPEASSPVALQKLLGYGTEGLADAPPLKHSDLSRSWSEFDRHKVWMYRRFQTDTEPEVQLRHDPVTL